MRIGAVEPISRQATLAHVAALAGADQVLFTLWPVRSGQAARFVAGLSFTAQLAGETTGSFLAEPTDLTSNGRYLSGSREVSRMFSSDVAQIGPGFLQCFTPT